MTLPKPIASQSIPVAIRPPWLLVVPSVVVAASLMLPLTYLVVRTAEMGAADLWAFVSQPRIVQVFVDSTVMAAAVTFFSALIAIPLAFLTVRTDLPGRRIWSILTTLPLSIPTYVGSFSLIATLGPRGSLLQTWLAPLGVDRLPSIYGWPGVIAAITLFSYPYLLLSVRAGLQGMDPAMEESARSLGHGPWSVFWRVTLPQLRPSIVAGSLLVSLYALQDFGTPSLMRFRSFTQAIFIQYRASFNRGLAAALSLMLVILVLMILWLEYRARTRARYYTRQSAATQWRPIPLGRWRWPALAFCSLVCLVCLGMPLGVIGFWLWRVPNTWEVLTRVLPYAWNSAWVAGWAAIAAMVLAIPVAVMSVRFPSRLTTLIERGTYIGYGLPGVVVALSLVFFGARYVPWLYQTMPMLVFAYLVLYLPQSVGTVRTSLLQVNPQMEESARSLGRTAWQVMREITLPLVRPGVLGGAVLVFLTTIKELPATLLLSPIGFRTLASEIWVATGDAAFGNAAAASLAMLVICGGLTLLVLSQERQRRSPRS